ncbi:nuclear transport factor 2 family protein [Aquipuribacter sp. SD81]|uniref:nuclear transport factor 2 family protein n=1 Tax=Aquipuribacter sp. SD81 TaxID=3127703 RepID=UPI0030158A0A
MVVTASVERLRAALAARDVDAVVACAHEDVVVSVDGDAADVVGRDELRAWLERLRDATADSRWVVHVSSRGDGSPAAVEDEVTLAWRPLPASAGSGPARPRWVVVAGSVRLEVAPGDGALRRARVRVDRAAVAAQLAGAERLPASSVRTEVALATFDPEASPPVLDERTLAPPAGHGARRAGRAVLVALGVLLAVGAVLGGLWWTDVLPAGLVPDGLLPERPAG